MSKIVAIANQKGGVGKTTTCVNLAAYLALMGKHVLAVDIDPQGNCSSGLGIEKNALDYSVYSVLSGEARASQAILHTKIKNLDILPANIDLAGAEVELVSVPEREKVLKKMLSPLRNVYDYIIIDCPPSLALLTVNALTFADSILIPIQGEFYALEGLSQLMATVRSVQKGLNRGIRIEGIVLTMYDGRTNLAVQVVEEVKKHFGDRVYATVVPRNVRLSEAPSHGQPITAYDRLCRGSEAYLAMADEFLSKNGEG